MIGFEKLKRKMEKKYFQLLSFIQVEDSDFLFLFADDV